MTFLDPVQMPDEAEIEAARAAADHRRQSMAIKRSTLPSASSSKALELTESATGKHAEQKFDTGSRSANVVPDVESGAGASSHLADAKTGPGADETESNQPSASQGLPSLRLSGKMVVDISSSLPFTPITLVFQNIR